MKRQMILFFMEVVFVLPCCNEAEILVDHKGEIQSISLEDQKTTLVSEIKANIRVGFGQEEFFATNFSNFNLTDEISFKVRSDQSILWGLNNVTTRMTGKSKDLILDVVSNQVNYQDEDIEVRTDLNKGVYYVRNPRQYQIENQSWGRSKLDSDYINRSVEIMSMLHLNNDDLSNIIVTSLKTDTAFKEEKGFVPHSLGETPLVYIHREISGIPVDGSKMAFLFDNVGEVKKVIGIWKNICSLHPIDIERLDKERIYEQAAQTVVAEYKRAAEMPEVYVSVRWILEETDTFCFEANLMGFARVEAAQNNSDNIMETESFVFSL